MFIYPPFILSNPPLGNLNIILLYFPLIIIISRDFLVTILRKRLENKNIILKASFSGKMKTKNREIVMSDFDNYENSSH